MPARSCLILLLTVASAASAAVLVPPPPLPVLPAVVELLDDSFDTMLEQINAAPGNDGGLAFREWQDVYSGSVSVRVTPFQCSAVSVPGWAYRIAEKPGPGEFRYLRFAWKRSEGAGIMLQLHNSKNSWNQRYLAGQRSEKTKGWGPALVISAQPPRDWQVVTRDLFKDYGEMTLTGLALTPMEDGSGLFDHMYLGRSLEDLERTSAAMLGKQPLAMQLASQEFDRYWIALGHIDVREAGQAIRTLTAARDQSAASLVEYMTSYTRSCVARDVEQWLCDVYAPDVQVQRQALERLEKCGATVLPYLAKLHSWPADDASSARLRALYQRYREDRLSPLGKELRPMRIVRILAAIDTQAARQALNELAKLPIDEKVRSAIKQALERS